MEKHFLNEIWIRHNIDMVSAHLLSLHLFDLGDGSHEAWERSWEAAICSLGHEFSTYLLCGLRQVISLLWASMPSSYKWRRLDWMSFSFLSRSKILCFFLLHLVCLPFLCSYLSHERGRQWQKERKRERAQKGDVSNHQPNIKLWRLNILCNPNNKHRKPNSNIVTFLQVWTQRLTLIEGYTISMWSGWSFKPKSRRYGKACFVIHAFSHHTAPFIRMGRKIGGYSGIGEAGQRRRRHVSCCRVRGEVCEVDE